MLLSFPEQPAFSDWLMREHKGRAMLAQLRTMLKNHSSSQARHELDHGSLWTCIAAWFPSLPVLASFPPFWGGWLPGLPWETSFLLTSTSQSASWGTNLGYPYQATVYWLEFSYFKTFRKLFLNSVDVNSCQVSQVTSSYTCMIDLRKTSLTILSFLKKILPYVSSY